MNDGMPKRRMFVVILHVEKNRSLHVTRALIGREQRQATRPLPYLCDSTSESYSTQHHSDWKPPDGGYGWVIVFVAFLIYIDFNCYSQLGIFMLDLADHFEVSKEAMGWMHATQTVIGRILGIVIGPLTVRLGVRWMVCAGCSMIAMGYLTSSFVNSFGLMYLTYGILIGIGCGCLFTAPTVAVQQYFTTKTSIAIGLSMTGYNTGVLIWPPFATWLKSLVGWKKTFLIESGIHATFGLICTILLRPPGQQQNFCVKCTKKNHPEKSTDQNSSSCKTYPKKHWILKIIDPSPLANPMFVLFLFCLFLNGIGMMTNFVYIPVRSEMMGIAGERAALQLTVYGCVGLFTVPLFGGIANSSCSRRDVMFAVGILMTGTITVVSVTYKTFPLLMLHAVLFAIFGGLTISVMNSLLVDIVGPEKTAVGAGWFAVTFGLAQAVVHPLTGFILDETGNPHYPFLVAGCCTMSGGLLAGVLAVLRKRTELRVWDAHSYDPGDVSHVDQVQSKYTGLQELDNNENDLNKVHNDTVGSVHM